MISSAAIETAKGIGERIGVSKGESESDLCFLKRLADKMIGKQIFSNEMTFVISLLTPA